MELHDFDLNLLRALDALLDEVNVTRAAERLCVTQPAMSGALRRLREHFDDELLIRKGRKMERTLLGSALQVSVRNLLSDIRMAVETRPSFDPATSNESFRISISDYGALVLMPEVLRLLSASAPNVSCNVETLSSTSFVELEKGYFDFAFAADHWSLYGDYGPSQEVATAVLFEDDFVCVVDNNNLAVGKELTLRQYGSLQHNSVAFGHGIESLIEEAWDRVGLDVRVAARAPDFSSLVLMVPGTPLIATAQRRLCEVLVSAVPLRIMECPLPVRALRETMLWNVRNNDDPAHQFMRAIFLEAAATISK